MMARAHPALGLRPFLPADTPLLAEIFRSSIEELTGDDYSQEQQQAWASAADDEEDFAARLAERLTLVATLGGSVVGFAALEGKDHIDMLYVHPAVAGRGVGTMLVDALEKLAASGAATSPSSATACRARASGSTTPPWKSGSPRGARHETRRHAVPPPLALL